MWPELFSQAQDITVTEGGTRRLWMNVDAVSEEAIASNRDMPLWLFAKLRQVRATMKSEVDAVVITRLLIEEALAGMRSKERTTGYRPLTAGELNENLDSDYLKILQIKYKANPIKVTALYNKMLDEWKYDDVKDYVSNFKPYTGVTDVIRSKVQSDPQFAQNVYIVSERRTDDIRPVLRISNLSIEHSHVLGRDPDDFFQGDIADDIVNISEQNPDSEVIYVDGNAETLMKLHQDDRFKNIDLKFASWGHSTPSLESKLLRDTDIQTLSPLQLKGFLQGEALPERLGDKSVIETIPAELLGLDSEE
ncbi:hypothetical protein AAMO2058_000818300 [Amorphochlora amoebiformis]